MVAVLLIPSFAYASWYNPFTWSWFKKKTQPAAVVIPVSPVVIEDVKPVIPEATTTPVVATTPIVEKKAPVKKVETPVVKQVPKVEPVIAPKVQTPIVQPVIQPVVEAPEWTKPREFAPITNKPLTPVEVEEGKKIAEESISEAKRQSRARAEQAVRQQILYMINGDGFTFRDSENDYKLLNEYIRNYSIFVNEASGLIKYERSIDGLKRLLAIFNEVTAIQ